MSYKALAIDLDGTLLIGEDLPSEHRRAVAEAAAAGMEIIIATARWRQMAEKIAKEIGFRKPIIACSGAQVRMPDGEDIFDHRLPDDFVRDLYELCNHERCIATITVEETVVIKLDGKPDMSLLPEEMQWVPALDTGEHHSPRIAAIQGTGVNELIKTGLGPRYNDVVNIYDSIGPSGKVVITITAKAANKGEALLAACQHMDIDPGSVLAFGDAENDIEMFRVAGASVAMGQADQTVKSAATTVTDANTEDGVAKVIDRLLSTGTL
jgi:HAD superfamily hydrolase (TIGR01484 family)